MTNPVIPGPVAVQTMGRTRRILLAITIALVLAVPLGRAVFGASVAGSKDPAMSAQVGAPAVPGLTKDQVLAVIAGLHTGSGSSVTQAVPAICGKRSVSLAQC